MDAGGRETGGTGDDDVLAEEGRTATAGTTASVRTSGRPPGRGKARRRKGGAPGAGPLFADACVLFDVRGLDGWCRAHFEVIAAALEGVCDAYVVTHVTRKGDGAPTGDGEADRRLASRTVELDDRDIFGGLEHAKDVSQGLIPGNCDLKFLAAAREMARYGRIVWWEYDVVCTGAIGATVTRLLEESAGCDLAGSYMSDDDADGWMWWGSFEAPEAVRRQRAFLPLFVASRALALGYAGLLARGWRGHAEVTLPSAARHLGLSSLDLGRMPSRFTSWPQFNALAPDGMDEHVPPFIHPVKGFAQLAGYALPDCEVAGIEEPEALPA